MTRFWREVKFTAWLISLTQKLVFRNLKLMTKMSKTGVRVKNNSDSSLLLMLSFDILTPNENMTCMHPTMPQEFLRIASLVSQNGALNLMFLSRSNTSLLFFILWKYWTCTLLTTTWILLIIYTINNTISSCYCHSRINIDFLYWKRWIYFHTVHLDCIMFSLASIFQSQKYVSECFWN